MSKILKVKITNPVGLYAIPASEMVDIAKAYQSSIYIDYNGKSVNMKSIMGVLSLGIPKGASVTIDIDGYDEYDAYNKLKSEFENKGLGTAI